jgi:hypothetical protein
MTRNEFSKLMNSYGYQYGNDALDNARVGFDVAIKEAMQICVEEKQHWPLETGSADSAYGRLARLLPDWSRK